MTKTRVWVTCAAIAGLIGLIAFSLLSRFAMTAPWLDRMLAIVALPGLLLTIVLGASPHGGSFGDARDWIVIPLGCGVVWGSVLFVLVYAARRRRPKAAAGK